MRFEQESFGALHQMMSGLSATERAETWDEVGVAWQQFEGPDGFTGTCQMILGMGVK